MRWKIHRMEIYFIFYLHGVVCEHLRYKYDRPK